MPYTQDTRLGELKVAGGIDLVLTRFAGTEAISEAFAFYVEALHETDPNVDFDKAIGKNCQVTIHTTGDKKRYFVGLLTEAKRTDDTDGGYRYSLVLRSWLHLLSKRTNTKIFHKKTVDRILSEVFGDYGMPFQYKGTRGYPELEYVVQYRETDFDFASRMMESHGLSYHHKFTEGQQEVLIVDTSREDMPGGAERELLHGEAQLRDKEVLFDWSKERVLATGKVKTRDYNFKAPSTVLETEEVAQDVKYENKDKEHYEQIYSQGIGEQISEKFGKDYAKYRLDSYQSEDNHFYGAGDSPGLAPGFIMTLAKHDTDNGAYVVLRSTHSLTVMGYRSGESSASSYSGQYEFYPSDTNKPYTPPMKTPKPIVGGIETGVVTGKHEIDVDEWGRVTVRFHWNRTKPEDESMKLRVMQPWASKGWGAVHWPRKDMEAIVSFVDGDPDRPLVIGTVYNGENMPPYDLKSDPSNRNISGTKSKTVGGSVKEYNEFILNDTPGKEVVRMHAQKNHESKILFDETRDIGNKRDTKIAVDDTLTVENNIMIEAKNQITLKVNTSTIVITAGSIEIKSPAIKITAQTTLETTGMTMAKHDGGGLMTITGGIVKIN